MEAAVFKGVGNPLSIEQVDSPVVRPGDLLIKVEYCGICGSDLHATEAGALVVPDGQVLGHEFTGTVVEMGADVGGGWQVGDHVTAVPVNACADCGRQCRLGMGIHCPNNIITGFGAPGAYAEYIRVDAGNVLRLPQGLGFREGATAEPLSVGHHVIDKAGMRPGSNVLVIGAGPIGLSCTAFAPLFRRPPRGGERVFREPARACEGDGRDGGDRPQRGRRGRTVRGDRRRPARSRDRVRRRAGHAGALHRPGEASGQGHGLRRLHQPDSFIRSPPSPRRCACSGRSATSRGTSRSCSTCWRAGGSIRSPSSPM